MNYHKGSTFRTSPFFILQMMGRHHARDRARGVFAFTEKMHRYTSLAEPPEDSLTKHALSSELDKAFYHATHLAY